LRRLVFLPATAGQIAAHHGFDRHGLQAAHEHGAAAHLFDLVRLHHAFGRLTRQVVGANALQPLEPEQRHLCQQHALAGDGVVHDHVEGRNPVAGDHEDAVLAHGIVVAHLAARQQGQGVQVGGVQCGKVGLGHGEKA